MNARLSLLNVNEKTTPFAVEYIGYSGYLRGDWVDWFDCPSHDFISVYNMLYHWCSDGQYFQSCYNADGTLKW